MFEKKQIMLLEATGLISISNWLLSKISDKGFESLCNNLTSSNKVNENFYKAVTNASQILQNKYPQALGGSINLFFTTDSLFDKLVKQLFVNSVIDEAIMIEEFDVDTLPEGFISEYITILKNEVSKDVLLNQFLSNKEIFILVHGINANVTAISKNSTLALSEIIQFKKLFKERFGDGFHYTEFLALYSQNALQNLSQVNFIGLGVDLAIKRKRKNLQDVFVKPYFQVLNTNFIVKEIVLENDYDGILEDDVLGDDVVEDDFDETGFFDENYGNDVLSYSDLFNFTNQIVVIGNPGSGKSVLIKSVICDIIEGNNKNFTLTFPLRIELRKYLSYKKSNFGNLINYIVVLLKSEYGITNITETVVDCIFKEQQSYIFFDGLDEIFKIEDKIDIKNNIENFHNTYPKVKSLTTSRIIGYDEAKLKEDTFCELMILSFNDEQIQEYIEKWYEKEEENIEIRDREIEGFLSKMHEIDRELVSNPLLLSLIVILYRNILKLPESKLEIYQSCTKTLVDKWDASKDLVIDLEQDVYRNKEKILADLAHWQYEQLSGDSVVISYDKAKNTVIRSLNEKLNLSDEFDLNKLAENFMEYAQKRSIYFDNNFTHKTFLEYYTAYWIYSNVEKKHKIDVRNNIISKYIDNSFWHIVLELLLNMIDKDQADSEIMDTLIEDQINQKDTALPFILSTISSFKNVSLVKKSFVINLAITKIIDASKNKKSNYETFRRETIEDQIYDSVKSLYLTDSNIKKIITQRLINEEYGDNPCLYLYYGLYIEIEFFNNFEGAYLEFKLSNHDLFQQVSAKSLYLFGISKYMGRENKDYFEEAKLFINNFGVDAMFLPGATFFENFNLGDYASYFLNNQINDVENFSKNARELEELGLDCNKLIAVAIQQDYFYYKFETIKSILDKIELENDILILKILLIIVTKSTMHNKTFASRVLNSTTNSLILQINDIKLMDDKIKFIKNIK